MEQTDLQKLESILRLADHIERCQTLKLITPEERVKSIAKLNDKIHKEIDRVLAIE